MAKRYFITGIGTEVGKTVVSAIVTQALHADYWKPIQSGDLDFSDSMKVASWISNSHTHFHTERHRLHTPMSPHAAANIDGVQIQLTDFELPPTANHLVVEGAGGLLVPLNDKDTVLDLIKQLQLEVILVSRHYLGSINHTLLSYEILRHRSIKIKGLVFNGNSHPTTENIIEKMTGLPVLFRLKEYEKIDKTIIATEASRVRTLKTL